MLYVYTDKIYVQILPCARLAAYARRGKGAYKGKGLVAENRSFSFPMRSLCVCGAPEFDFQLAKTFSGAIPFIFFLGEGFPKSTHKRVPICPMKIQWAFSVFFFLALDMHQFVDIRIWTHPKVMVVLLQTHIYIYIYTHDRLAYLYIIHVYKHKTQYSQLHF